MNNASPPKKKISLKDALTLGIGGLISGLCLWFVFRNVNLGDLWASLKTVSPAHFIVCVVLFYASMYLRAIRWGLLFRPDYKFSGWAVFRPLMICFAFNSIMPGRVGEVIRAFYVNKKEKVPFATALATVVSERIFDGVTVLLFLIGSLAMLPPIDPHLKVEMGKYAIEGSQISAGLHKIMFGSGVLVAGVVFLMLPGVERLLERMVRGFPAMPEGLAGKLMGFISGIIRGFQAVRDPRSLCLIVFYSLAIWILNALSSLVLAWGMPGVSNMNFLQSVATMTLIGVFILVPAAPGYWGLYEAGAIFSLIVLGVQSDRSLATAYALTMHLVQYVPIVVVGLYFASRDRVHVSMGQGGGHAEPVESTPST